MALKTKTFVPHIICDFSNQFGPVRIYNPEIPAERLTNEYERDRKKRLLPYFIVFGLVFVLSVLANSFILFILLSALGFGVVYLVDIKNKDLSVLKSQSSFIIGHNGQMNNSTMALYKYAESFASYGLLTDDDIHEIKRLFWHTAQLGEIEKMPNGVIDRIEEILSNARHKLNTRENDLVGVILDQSNVENLNNNPVLHEQSTPVYNQANTVTAPTKPQYLPENSQNNYNPILDDESY